MLQYFTEAFWAFTLIHLADDLSKSTLRQQAIHHKEANKQEVFVIQSFRYCSD